MNKNLKIIIGGFLYSALHIFPAGAVKNTIMDTSYIFEIQKNRKSTLSRRTTNAAFLQNEGIKGEVKNGRKLVAAVIDMHFYPEYTNVLKKAGAIHPAAFSEHLIFDPDEKLESVSLTELDSKIFNLEHLVAHSQKEWENNQEKASQLKELMVRKQKYNAFFKPGQKDSHGSAVMEAINLMAPKAQILPIDLLGITREMDNMTVSERLAFAIRKAIKHKVDVINLSLGFKLTDDIVKACKEATSQGIAIITAAGNSSIKGLPFRLDEIWDRAKSAFVKNPKQELFEKLQGKGIRFVGAVKYAKNGEEKVTNYTEHPSQSTEKHFIFAPGNKLPIHASLNPDELVSGTSFASPTVVGAYLLLKEYMLEKNFLYQLSNS